MLFLFFYYYYFSFSFFYFTYSLPSTDMLFNPIRGMGQFRTSLIAFLFCCLCLTTQTIEAQTCNSQTNPCQGTDFYSQIQCSISQNNVNTANLTTLQQVVLIATQQITNLTSLLIQANAQITTLQQQTASETIANVIANHPTRVNKRQPVLPNYQPAYSYDPLNPQDCVCQDATCFQGAWKRLTYGQGAYASAISAVNSGSARGQQYGGFYLSINVTTNLTGGPIAFVTGTSGSPKYPRTMISSHDLFTSGVSPLIPGVATNQYYFQTPTQLVNMYQSQPFPLAAYATVKAAAFNLINNCTMTVVNSAFSPEVGGGGTTNLVVYERISEMPAMSNNIDWTDKLNLFDAMVDFFHAVLVSGSPQSGDQDYLGPEVEDKIFTQITTTGFNVTTPVRRLRVTNTLNYAAYTTDALTTIFTGDPTTGEGIHAFCPAGSSVTFSGFPPAWGINGFVKNAVSFLLSQGIPNPNPKYVDSGPGGSLNDHAISFLVRLNTTSLQSLANMNGFLDVPVGASVFCSHQVTSGSSYASFMAAITAYYQATYQIGTHFGIVPNLNSSPNGTFFIVDSDDRNWTNLANLIKAGNVKSAKSRIRTGSMASNGWLFLSGVTLSSPSNPFSATDAGTNLAVNVPFPVDRTNNPNFNPPANLDALNYLVNVKTLIYALQGTLDPDQPNPTVWGSGNYALLPGPGRAKFVSQLIDANISTVTGFANPNVPTGWRVLGPAPGSFGVSGANADNAAHNYFAQIDPALTGGQVVCYIRLSSGISETSNLMTTGYYAPEKPGNSSNPRNSRESINAVMAPIFQYFNLIGCKSYIYNNVYNGGGSSALFTAMMEFVGDNRQFRVLKSAPLSKSTVGPLRVSDYVNYPTVNNNAYQGQTLSRTFDVQRSAQLYPGSVIQGTPSNPIPFIFLTDIHAISTADFACPMGLGTEWNGHIGGNVYVKVVGSVDGRFKGSGSSSNSFMPLILDPATGYRMFNTSTGAPTVPFTFQIDNLDAPFSGIGKSENPDIAQNPLLTPHRTLWRGKNGGTALPTDFESVVLEAIGYNPINLAQHPPLGAWNRGSLGAGIPDTFNRSTWRHFYLEEAIRVATEPLSMISSAA